MKRIDRNASDAQIEDLNIQITAFKNTIKLLNLELNKQSLETETDLIQELRAVLKTKEIIITVLK